jgi:cystathionine beta-synthase
LLKANKGCRFHQNAKINKYFFITSICKNIYNKIRILRTKCNTILGTIGGTPLVKLNRVTKEIDALILAKVETFNPGNSTKDRMALKMIDDAEADGRLQPGGTIIEGTSGNTGMGLALVAIIRDTN